MDNCVVKDCENARGDGNFVEASICVPCSHVLYGGKAEHGTSILFTQAKEIERLRRDNACMTAALEEIEERAQDNYDGPEDRTHGPYLQMARYGLGRTP